MDQRELELCKRMKTGDTHAFAEWVDRNQDRFMLALERKVGSALRSKLELEDILQEAIARGVRDLSKIEFGDQDPYGWFLQVLDRQVVDLHRYHFAAQKRAASREISADQVVGEGSQKLGLVALLVASMTTPSAAVSRDMRLARMYHALEQLSPEMQQAIRLRYLENKSNPEVAKILDKSDVATRVLVSRALRKLERALKEGDDSAGY